MESKDDLKRIQGIGPSVERKLNQAGIQTFAQLAALDPNEIASVLNGMVGFSVERIADDDWPKQARELQSPPQDIVVEPMISPKGGMHYAVFTVEFLLDDDNEVKRTLIKEVQTQNQTSWASWDAARLTRFLIENAGLNIPQPLQDQASEPQPKEVVQLPAPPTQRQPTIEKSTVREVMSEVSVQKVKVIKGVEWQTTPQHIHRERTFAVQLTLNLHNVQLLGDQPLDYAVTIFARPLGARQRKLLGEIEGHLTLADFVDLEIPDLKLPLGAYHLDVLVRLTPPGATLAQRHDLMAMAESGIVHVY